MRRTRSRPAVALAWALPLGLASCASRGPSTVAVPAAPPPAKITIAAPPPPSPEPVARAKPAPAEAPAPEIPPVDRAESTPESAARGWLGVELEPAVTGEAGVRVARVVPRSPAEKAGLLPGDLIERLDNDAVGAPADVVGIVGSRHEGSRVGVMLKRQSAERLIAVTLAAAPAPDEVYRMSFVDQPAPQFEALNAAKGSILPTLAAQRGHVLVVEFWSPDCVPCRALIPHMNQWHATYGARGLRVLGITTEQVTRAASAAAALGIEYPVASDETTRTSRAYQAFAVPSVFVIDRKGTVRDVMRGYDTVRLPKLDRLVDQLLAER